MKYRQLGCRQAVSQQILILSYAGSNPATPAKKLWGPFWTHPLQLIPETSLPLFPLYRGELFMEWKECDKMDQKLLPANTTAYFYY